jgi:hypothetical protein
MTYKFSDEEDSMPRSQVVLTKNKKTNEIIKIELNETNPPPK